MISKCLAQLLADLDVTRSFSPPAHEATTTRSPRATSKRQNIIRAIREPSPRWSTELLGVGRSSPGTTTSTSTAASRSSLRPTRTTVAARPGSRLAIRYCTPPTPRTRSASRTARRSAECFRSRPTSTRRSSRLSKCSSPVSQTCRQAPWGRFANPVGTSWRVDETYVSIRGHWHYLYRAVDKQGKMVDFLLRPDRGVAAAPAFFRKALGAVAPRVPRKITLDGQRPSRRALWLLRREHPCWRNVRVRTNRYLNNIVEADRNFERPSAPHRNGA
jgi:DDE domain